MDKIGYVLLPLFALFREVYSGEYCYTSYYYSEYCSYGCCDNDFDYYDHCCAAYSWIYGVVVVGILIIGGIVLVIIIVMKKQAGKRRNVRPVHTATVTTVHAPQPPPYQPQGQMPPSYQQPMGYPQPGGYAQPGGFPQPGPQQYPPPAPANYGQQDVAYPPM
ncbi:hypothetical protein MAR_020862 [Mya arenaria]|uniref:Uncharacterized protein n=1 Tax=Mya arenaria TaxID=6604 RepID=A0ABY7E624_MYAAR|nr:protein shisa-5-like [Mya arenaria]WAR05493.1 hypothetical protein MAR_020862 [Mya arenaria]